MPFKYVILNLRKWRRALVCIKKARKANKKTHLSDEIEGCVSHNLKLQVQKPFMNAKIQFLLILLYAFLRDLLF